jgi:hypothetical protein
MVLHPNGSNAHVHAAGGERSSYSSRSYRCACKYALISRENVIIDDHDIDRDRHMHRRLNIAISIDIVDIELALAAAVFNAQLQLKRPKYQSGVRALDIDSNSDSREWPSVFENGKLQELPGRLPAKEASQAAGAMKDKFSSNSRGRRAIAGARRDSQRVRLVPSKALHATRLRLLIAGAIARWIYRSLAVVWEKGGLHTGVHPLELEVRGKGAVRGDRCTETDASVRQSRRREVCM